MTEYEALENLMGAYLHEDLFVDHATVDEVIDEFARGEPADARLLRRDVDRFLAIDKSDLEIAAELDAMGLCYLPLADGWNSYREWLVAVADRVDGALRQNRTHRQSA